MQEIQMNGLQYEILENLQEVKENKALYELLLAKFAKGERLIKSIVHDDKTYYLANGAIFCGCDGGLNGSFNKYGKILFPDGGCYNGGIENGKMDGQGEYTWPSGSSYKGNWKDDKKEGYGEYKWENGAVYKGNWKDDKKEGRGIYTEANGQQLDVLCIDDGIFVEEKLIQQVPVETGNGGFFG